MKTKLIQVSTIAALTVAGTLIAADQAPAPSAPPSSSPTDTRNPTSAAGATQFQGKITAIDKESKMVTVQDSVGKSHKLHIGDTTKLSKGSTSSDSATWDDLKVGMEVRGTHKMQGSMNHAETVMIGSAPEAK
jgi:hypothetical protein